MVNVIFFTNLLNAHDFRLIPESWRFVDQNFIGYKLAEIFIRGDHICRESFFFRFARQGTDNVVRLIAFQFEDRDFKAFDQPPDIRQGGGNVFGHFLPLGFVFDVFRLPQGRGEGIESDPDVGGFFILQNIIQRIGKAQNGRSIQTG